MAYVLIVDDDEDFAEATATVLRGAGHEVGIALDTKSAVTNMQQKRPDLAVLDVMFPENVTGGFELARRMNGDPGELGQVPILILTAINMAYPLGFGDDDIDDRWMPVAGFLEKPVSFEKLRKTVARMLGEEATGNRGGVQ